MTKGKGRSRAGSDTKHDRSGLKPRSIYTKKGGAGGHYTWGKPGDETDIPEISKGDPNYDSEEDVEHTVFLQVEESKLTGRHKHDFSYLNYAGEAIQPPKLSMDEFKTKVDKALREFYVNGDIEEFINGVTDWESSVLHFELVKRLIVSSMEKTDRERELASVLLVALQDQHLLPVSQLAKGFERLFENVPDLMLDIVNVRKLLAQFLARAVADDIIPPAFLNDQYIGSLAGGIVSHAKTLLSVKHGLGRLEKVWGVTLQSSVDDIKQEIKMLLLEYLSSANDAEVVSILKAMNVPYFHHEVVKRGVVLALERKEREQAMISVLLKHLTKAEVISRTQLLLGFQRLFQSVDDLKLDNPDAEQVINIFAKQALLDSCITSEELNAVKLKAQANAELERKVLEEDVATGQIRERADSLPH